MELAQHPQYRTYVWDRELDRRCREGVAAWRASGEPIVAEKLALCWTFEGAQAFARALSRLTQEYNRVLWEQFSYCRQCGGKCCVGYEPHVDVFDSIVLALLGQPLPVLPAEIEATAHDCIYRTAKGCVWPVEWKPVECWTYYCLGRSGHEGDRGRHRADPSDERYAAIAEELEYVLFRFLPEALHDCAVVWGEPLDLFLCEPLDFAEAFNDALFEIFLFPFGERYPVIEE